MKQRIEEKLDFYKIEDLEPRINKIIKKEKISNIKLYASIALLMIMYNFATSNGDYSTAIGVSCFASAIFIGITISSNKEFKTSNEMCSNNENIEELFEYIGKIEFIEKCLDKKNLSKDKRDLNDIDISKSKNIEYKVVSCMIEDFLFRYICKVFGIFFIILEVIFATIVLNNNNPQYWGMNNMMRCYILYLLVYPMFLTFMFSVFYGTAPVHFDNKAYKYAEREIKNYYEQGMIDAKDYKLALYCAENYRNEAIMEELELDL